MILYDYFRSSAAYRVRKRPELFIILGLDGGKQAVESSCRVVDEHLDQVP